MKYRQLPASSDHVLWSEAVPVADRHQNGPRHVALERANARALARDRAADERDRLAESRVQGRPTFDQAMAAADRAAAAIDRRAGAADREFAVEQAQHLLEALEHSREIGMAIGIIAEQSEVSVDEAFRMLTERSQRSNIKLRDIARQIVDRHS
jgi:hypothetical protein